MSKASTSSMFFCMIQAEKIKKTLGTSLKAIRFESFIFKLNKNVNGIQIQNK
jgi:hypothetical protein